MLLMITTILLFKQKPIGYHFGYETYSVVGRRSDNNPNAQKFEPDQSSRSGGQKQSEERYAEHCHWSGLDVSVPAGFKHGTPRT